MPIKSKSQWSKEQVKLAFNLYCQLPFGKLHKGNKEIIELASLIDRTPSAVAMKLGNIASLDPAIISTGRAGLGNASALDREVWEEFATDWDQLALECLQINEKFQTEKGLSQTKKLGDIGSEYADDFTGETKAVVVEQRIRQSFFRRAILASYQGKCCMSGLSEPRLLIASHIVPWSIDRSNRLNPCNGLCLSALHDKAFDHGLISVDSNFCVILSEEMEQRSDDFVQQFFLPLAGQPIMLPDRFAPEQLFLERHRQEVFLGDGL